MNGDLLSRNSRRIQHMRGSVVVVCIDPQVFKTDIRAVIIDHASDVDRQRLAKLDDLIFFGFYRKAYGVVAAINRNARRQLIDIIQISRRAAPLKLDRDVLAIGNLHSIAKLINQRDGVCQLATFQHSVMIDLDLCVNGVDGVGDLDCAYGNGTQGLETCTATDADIRGDDNILRVLFVDVLIQIRWNRDGDTAGGSAGDLDGLCIAIEVFEAYFDRIIASAYFIAQREGVGEIATRFGKVGAGGKRDTGCISVIHNLHRHFRAKTRLVDVLAAAGGADDFEAGGSGALDVGIVRTAVHQDAAFGFADGNGDGLTIIQDDMQRFILNRIFHTGGEGDLIALVDLWVSAQGDVHHRLDGDGQRGCGSAAFAIVDGIGDGRHGAVPVVFWNEVIAAVTLQGQLTDASDGSRITRIVCRAIYFETGDR